MFEHYYLKFMVQVYRKQATVRVSADAELLNEMLVECEIQVQSVAFSPQVFLEI